MSAALVESVREAERLENVPGAWHEADVARNALDLTAILAALTEAEALRAQNAAAQERTRRLHDILATAVATGALADWFTDPERDGYDVQSFLVAPTDTAALRAMLEKVWMLGYDAPDATDGNAETQRTTDIDRVLGGS